MTTRWYAPLISGRDLPVKVEHTDLGMTPDGICRSVIKIPGYTLRTKFKQTSPDAHDERREFEDCLLRAFDIDFSIATEIQSDKR